MLFTWKKGLSENTSEMQMQLNAEKLNFDFNKTFYIAVTFSSIEDGIRKADDLVISCNSGNHSSQVRRIAGCGICYYLLNIFRIIGYYFNQFFECILFYL